jgi:release factor glutamine methyltransferase
LLFAAGVLIFFREMSAIRTSTAEQQSWTILSLVNWSTEYLTEKGIDSPRLTTELLLCRVLDSSRIDLYTNFDKPLFSRDLLEFKSLLKRRVAHEPLQYILGETEFMGLRFSVDRRVLIPRPETEFLVEQVLQTAKNSSVTHILDVGTGSGNIAISLAKYLGDIRIDAIDVSSDALDVARENTRKHAVEETVRLFIHNILSEKLPDGPSPYDVIVSNPPYISRMEFELLQPEVKEFEPRIATTDMSDGLTFFRVLAERGKKLLKSGGTLCVEVGYNQAGDVTELFEQSGYTHPEIGVDYQKIQRVVSARYG